MAGHSVTALHVHVVFVVKYRRKLLTAEHRRLIHGSFAETCFDYSCMLIEFDGEEDHVHALITIPPTIRLCDLVRSMKSRSSGALLSSPYSGLAALARGGSVWTPSYFACSCGGAPLEVIKAYVRSQSSQ